MNKKSIIIICSIVLIFVLLIVSFNMGEGSSKKNNKLSDDADVILANAKEESSNASEDKMRDFTYIDIDKYLELYSSNTNTLVLFARPDCQYCEIAEPILKTILFENEGFDINYINISELGDEGGKKLYESNNFFESIGTPLLIIVKDNEIVDRVDGLTDKTHYEDFLRTYQFIK